MTKIEKIFFCALAVAAIWLVFYVRQHAYDHRCLEEKTYKYKCTKCIETGLHYCRTYMDTTCEGSYCARWAKPVDSNP